MRLVEFRRFLDDDNALRARFELERGHVLNVYGTIGVPFRGQYWMGPRSKLRHGTRFCTLR